MRIDAFDALNWTGAARLCSSAVVLRVWIKSIAFVAVSPFVMGTCRLFWNRVIVE